MQNRPAISVVMAIYNTEKYLAKSIQSVIDQSFQDWELICINDGSTDSSLQILTDFAAKDNRIKVYTQENSGRHAIVFNRAVELANGDYIYSLDSDDYFSSDILEKSYSRILETNADLCLPDLCFIDTNEIVSHTIVAINYDYSTVLSNRKAVELSLDWQIHGVGLWKRSLLKEIKSDEDGYSVEFSARQRLLQCKSVVFSKGVYYYLQHETSTTKKLGLRQFYAVEIDYKVMTLLKENSFELSVIQDFEWKRLQRIINLYTFYFSNKRDLNSLKQQISSIIKKSFNDIQLNNCKSELQQLSNRMSIKYRIIFLHFIIFQCYCFFKNYSSKTKLD